MGPPLASFSLSKMLGGIVCGFLWFLLNQLICRAQEEDATLAKLMLGFAGGNLSNIVNMETVIVTSPLALLQ